MNPDLSKFNNHDFQRGASKSKELIWLLLRGFFFEFSVLPWNKLRCQLLNTCGANIHPTVIIKPQAKITFPWKLTIGKNCWLGENAWLMNLAPIEICDNVVISQAAFLCTGSHDWSKVSFDLITNIHYFHTRPDNLLGIFTCLSVNLSCPSDIIEVLESHLFLSSHFS